MAAVCDRKDVSFLTSRSYLSSPWGLLLGFNTHWNDLHKSLPCVFPTRPQEPEGPVLWELSLLVMVETGALRAAQIIRYFPAEKQHSVKTEKMRLNVWYKADVNGNTMHESYLNRRRVSALDGEVYSVLCMRIKHGAITSRPRPADSARSFTVKMTKTKELVCVANQQDWPFPHIYQLPQTKASILSDRNFEWAARTSPSCASDATS